jgi:SAM-dependent methyltransferase
MGTVLSVLRGLGLKRVLDLGCGEGKLLRYLLADSQFESILGMDVSSRSLEIAKERLKLDQLPEKQKARINHVQGSLMYRDQRLSGFDAAAVIEVIEHLDAPRLSAYERVLFEFAHLAYAVITTPNSEYNSVFETLPAGPVPPSGPPIRVDTSEIRAMGTGGCSAIWLSSPLPAHRTGRSGTRSANTDGHLLPAGPHCMKITIPELSLVMLVGPSGSGKSSFGRIFFQRRSSRQTSAEDWSRTTITISPLLETRSIFFTPSFASVLRSEN